MNRHQFRYSPGSVWVLARPYFVGTYIDGTPSWNYDGDAHGLWWEFVGTVILNENGGDGDTVHTDYIKGHFKYLPTLAGVLDPRIPMDKEVAVRQRIIHLRLGRVRLGWLHSPSNANPRFRHFPDRPLAD